MHEYFARRWLFNIISVIVTMYCFISARDQNWSPALWWRNKMVMLLSRNIACTLAIVCPQLLSCWDEQSKENNFLQYGRLRIADFIDLNLYGCSIFWIWTASSDFLYSVTRTITPNFGWSRYVALFAKTLVDWLSLKISIMDVFAAVPAFSLKKENLFLVSFDFSKIFPHMSASKRR